MSDEAVDVRVLLVIALLMVTAVMGQVFYAVGWFLFDRVGHVIWVGPPGLDLLIPTVYIGLSLGGLVAALRSR